MSAAEFRFIFDHIIDFDALTQTPHFAEAKADLRQAILEQAERLCEHSLKPLQRLGDVSGARLENGAVRDAPGFGAAYKEIARGGWVGISAPTEQGGMGLPLTLSTAVNEMMAGACLALQICPLLTQGQIEALCHHASPELQALYLPNLISGRWTGTMNLTEPQAGSDLAALISKAEPRGDGSYAVSGKKIFISYGDHQMAENICHLVLARLPDAPPGIKGISLFLVPKFLPKPDGSLGGRNQIRVMGVEHKLGIHGSPTCSLSFDGATGWLVGPPHGGMAAMFTMMNNARLGVAAQGIGVAQASFDHALRYARERRQGPTPLAKSGPIGDHADVRRMLMHMRAEIFAARCLALSCAKALDMAASGDQAWAARATFLTPIAKICGTETGMHVAEDTVQVFGGMGVIEETGAAQFHRDVRVTSIYEGTNGIQAMDLTGRKLADNGAAAFALIGEIQRDAETARASQPQLADAVWAASESLRETTEVLLACPAPERFGGALAYGRGFARILGADAHLKAACATTSPDHPLRLSLAKFYISRILPQYSGYLAEARMGNDALYDLSLGDLAS